jgi:hypothetical protein
LKWFKIMIKFHDEMQILANFTHFEKVIFIQQWLTQNMWAIGATICICNNKLQKISFKKKFIWKNEKGLKKTQIFCKIFFLAPIYVLAHVYLIW